MSKSQAGEYGGGGGGGGLQCRPRLRNMVSAYFHRIVLFGKSLNFYGQYFGSAYRKEVISLDHRFLEHLGAALPAILSWTAACQSKNVDYTIFTVQKPEHHKMRCT